MTGKDRRALVARSHQLKPIVTIAGDDVTEATLAHVRALFARQELLKVRVQTDSNAVCDAIGAELAARAPCALIKRIGRVLVLYRGPARDADSGG